jgi:hypothetical protein
MSLLLFFIAYAYAARVAVVVPVHPPKFSDLDKLIESKHKFNVDVDIHIVFCTSQTLGQWNETARNLTSIYPTVYGGNQALKAHHPVFHKKYWLAEQIADRYEYLYMVDAEVQFIKEFDAYAVAKEIIDRKVVFGTQTCCGMYAVIPRDTMSRYSQEDQTFLRKKLQGTYTWFNEIPVLETKSMKEFLTEFKVTSTWNPTPDFDQLDYQYFMILRYGWSVLDLTEVTGMKCSSLGEVGGGNRAAIKASKPHWATAYAVNFPKFSETNVVMTFNHDWEMDTGPWYGAYKSGALVFIRDLVDFEDESKSCGTTYQSEFATSGARELSLFATIAMTLILG